MLCMLFVKGLLPKKSSPFIVEEGREEKRSREEIKY